MTKIIDEHLIDKAPKPKVNFTKFFILLAVLLFFIWLDINSNLLIDIIKVTTIATIPSWALAMHQRCKRNSFVLIILVLGLLLHLYFLFILSREIVDSFKYGLSFVTLKYIFVFYGSALSSYFIFKRTKLKKTRNIFIPKRDIE
jgi:hypothetical protein